MPITPATDQELEQVREQLGREPRGVVGVAASCICGAPLVVATAPRLPDGTPFPTTYYLTHPQLTLDISRLEAAGQMRQFNNRLDGDDEQLIADYKAAHNAYLFDREQLAAQLGLAVPEIAGISAGGMPTRVKCLHALAGHALAAGPGVNPVGDEVLTLIGYHPDACICS